MFGSKFRLSAASMLMGYGIGSLMSYLPIQCPIALILIAGLIYVLEFIKHPGVRPSLKGLGVITYILLATSDPHTQSGNQTISVIARPRRGRGDLCGA